MYQALLNNVQGKFENLSFSWSNFLLIRDWTYNLGPAKDDHSRVS